jgi:nicotinamidase/pyrazinamidase
MVRFDRRSALVVVDVQNDFADPAGGLFVAGGPGVVAACNELIGEALAAGASIHYTQDWHPAETPHFETGGGPWPVHCVAETWGAELHPDLRIEGGIVRKGVGGEDGYSGFSVRHHHSGEVEGTELARRLREAGAERVVVVGLAADVCVKETALDAVRHGFETVVVRSATASVDAHGEAAVRLDAELAAAGVTVEP